VFSFGDLVREIASERGVEPTREKLRDLGVKSREKHGLDYLARKMVEKIENSKKEPMPTQYPNKKQVESLFSDSELLKRVKEKIPRKRWDEFLYQNNRNKLKNLNKSQYVELFPTIPEDRRDKLEMKDKTTREYKEEYQRRD